mmetsp:Transcript_68703/g.223691  ORF Transcript_68703/g.223691 Transcript_68703/m.223691 type:complete len:201 (-) Transcript_68703:22-624(-)
MSRPGEVNACWMSREPRSRPAALATLTIRGDDCDMRSNGSIARVTPSVPKKLVFTVMAACCSKGVKATLPYSVGSLKQTAALLTSTSSLPNWRSMRSLVASKVLASVRSSRLKTASQPAAWSSAAAFDPSCSSRQPSTTVWSGSEPSRRAISLPMPLLAPVTRTTRLAVGTTSARPCIRNTRSSAERTTSSTTMRLDAAA